jgi:nucleoid-associated protein YgaU
MVILVGIEGLTGDANNPQTGYTGSFIHKLVTQWPDQQWAKYVAGPGVVSDVVGTGAIAYRTAMNMKFSLQNPGTCGLILAGYSQGGAAAIVAAHMLKKAGVQVDCLALFDSIDRDASAGTTFVPDNVQYTVHGMRSYSSGSRPLLGNCGWIVPNEKHLFRLKITHWGAGGVPLYNGLPPGVKPTDLVSETNWVTGNPKLTNVTWQEDLNAASVLWAIMNTHISAVYMKCNQTCAAPPVGVTYTVVKGDSLSVIAGKYWNDVLLWPLLYDANKNTIGTNYNLIKPGQPLVIPDIKTFTQSQLDAARARGRNWKAA